MKKIFDSGPIFEADTTITFLPISGEGPTRYLVFRNTKYIYAHADKINNPAGKQKKKFIVQDNEKIRKTMM
jgi:hypothetical protein